MNVDGALNVAGMSLEILAVVAGVIASPAGAGVRRRLADWGERAKASGYQRLRLVFVLAFIVVSAVVAVLLPRFPASWPGWVQFLLPAVIGALLGALMAVVGALSVPPLTRWVLSQLPASESEVGVFLGLAGGVFGVGVILQLIAVATP